MIYGSVCSGIEAATVSWHSLGWSPAWFSEIEPFPCRVLKYYYPHVPNLGDMLKIEKSEIFQKEPIHLLVGGTPCQSFSFAGLRQGLTAATGNLALEFCRILAIKRPRWFVWENVPGVLSSFSNDPEGVFLSDEEKIQTADFATLLTAFRECGYCCAWRVLDAQFFGVPQRRRRVFVVGYFGNDWRPPAAVLFEPKSLRGNTSPLKEQGKGIAGTIGKCTGGRSIGAEEVGSGMLIAGTLDASYGKLQGCSGQDACHGHSTLVFGGNNTEGPIKISPALNAGRSNGNRLDFESNAFLWSIMPQNGGKDYKAKISNVSQPLGTQVTVSCDQGGDIIQQKAVVRRLTPLECERLQGFPDNYTNIPGAKDSPRYEAIGNSMATVVMRWLGEQIDFYDKVFK